MAIKEIKREWSPCQLDYVKTFLLHSEKDVKDLPKCCVGSKATVSETDNEYFCTESGWKLGSELGNNEVVILPETAVTVTEGQGYITTPLSATPTGGATAKVTYNGMEYLCTVVAAADEEATGYMLGNLDFIGNGGGNPDAPFVVMLIPDGVDINEDGTMDMYGTVMPVDGATSVTLSIVQVGAESGGGSSSGGSGVCVVTVTADTENMSDFTNVKADKTFTEMRAAYESGGLLWCRLIVTMTSGTLRFECIHNATVLEATEDAMPMFVFQCVAMPTTGVAIKDDDSVWVMNEG